MQRSHIQPYCLDDDMCSGFKLNRHLIDLKKGLLNRKISLHSAFAEQSFGSTRGIKGKEK